VTQTFGQRTETDASAGRARPALGADRPAAPIAEALEAPFHSLALAGWLTAALAPSVLTRNPYFLALTLLAIAVTHRRLASRAEANEAWRGFAWFSAFFIVFALVVNALMGGAGRTPLIELPAWRWTHESGATLFQIGGAITLESLVYSACAALALFAVIAALAAFNTLVNHYSLLRNVPPFLYQAGAVVSIALTFIPQLFQAQREIREAQALRGADPRRPREWGPFAAALLGEGLERAMTLAESMEARGFCGPPGERALARRLIIAGGLALILYGALAPSLLNLVGWPFSLAGGALIVLILWRIARHNRRSRYRRELWRRRDSALAACSAFSLLFLAAWHWLDPAALRFNPFPQAHWPPFEPWLAAPLLFVAAPTAIHAIRTRTA